MDGTDQQAPARELACSGIIMGVALIASPLCGCGVFGAARLRGKPFAMIPEPVSQSVGAAAVVLFGAFGARPPGPPPQRGGPRGGGGGPLVFR